MVAQPITGVLLARKLGLPLTEPWLLASIALYLVAGAFWLPVVWMQRRMRDLASEALAGDGEDDQPTVAVHCQHRLRAGRGTG